jgi:DNA-binding response OmpR family regulator
VKILVADDAPDIRQAVARALAPLTTDVDTAADGTQALRLLRQRRYDVLLLDVLTSGVSGLDLIAAAMTANADSRVIMISAVNEPRTRLRCFELGAVDYLSKPFVLAELVARVRVHTRPEASVAAPVERRRGERRSDGRRANDLAMVSGTDPSATTARFVRTSVATLDLVKRAVIADGTTIPLSARESLVLTYLMRRVGSVCSREDILKMVWGSQASSGNVVDVYVGRLRAKLPGGSITTVRNAGYAFNSA